MFIDSGVSPWAIDRPDHVGANAVRRDADRVGTCTLEFRAKAELHSE